MGDGRVGQAELAVLAAAPLRRRREEEVGQGGVALGAVWNLKETSLNFHRREEGKRPPWIDGWKGWEREAGRTTNRVSTPSSSSSAISKVEL